MMFPQTTSLTLFTIWTLCQLQLAAGNFVQFYDRPSHLGVALSTFTNSTGNGSGTGSGTGSDQNELLFQLTVPSSAGWGAIGTGDKMDGSLMFILYPSTDSDEATVSVRTAHGHNTPEAFDGLQYRVLKTSNDGASLTADVQCFNCTKYSGNSIDITSAKQPWIWAIGPGDPVRSNSQNADIEQHSHYGVFFAKMDKARATAASVPSVTGTFNINTTAQPGYINDLVVLHAILLGVAFVIAFPLGAVSLRVFRSFKIHWIVQLCTSVACLIGLCVAIAFSVLGVEWTDFNSAHQIIGIVVVVLTLVQGMLGYRHHMNYKNLKGRTVVSYVHILFGRGIIWFGMLNSVLGFLLADSNGKAAGAGAVSIIVILLMEGALFWARRRGLSKSKSSSTTILPLTTMLDPDRVWE
ncbi:hypothetical protein EDD37DRAFT_250963 [Exophiala viscosa]|uniref:Cytochrome b561 domain-containing protein n=1 Tax=Exophiala viscosa TaxID=2486360 RepID=A0AAN6E6I3_9EURO|nr:hypothetical protein EDD36DRAFT_459649 [Exophiala viscosa]KAI1627118.1 hypothetical protein EDD37DRAFT_250963 [Exophiala viscosa]